MSAGYHPFEIGGYLFLPRGKHWRVYSPTHRYLRHTASVEAAVLYAFQHAFRKADAMEREEQSPCLPLSNELYGMED